MLSPSYAKFETEPNDNHISAIFRVLRQWLQPKLALFKAAFKAASEGWMTNDLIKPSEFGFVGKHGVGIISVSERHCLKIFNINAA